jgi:hypothetical protein
MSSLTLKEMSLNLYLSNICQKKRKLDGSTLILVMFITFDFTFWGAWYPNLKLALSPPDGSVLFWLGYYVLHISWFEDLLFQAVYHVCEKYFPIIVKMF